MILFCFKTNTYRHTVWKDLSDSVIFLLCFSLFSRDFFVYKDCLHICRLRLTINWCHFQATSHILWFFVRGWSFSSHPRVFAGGWHFSFVVCFVKVHVEKVLCVMSNTYETANIFSRVTFSWISSLIRLGSLKHLERLDIPSLPCDYTCSYVTDIVRPIWKIEKTKEDPFIGRSFFTAFRTNFILAGLMFCPYVVVVLLQPYFVTSILKYVTTGSSMFLGIRSGVGQAIVLGILSQLGVLALSASYYFTSTASLRIKSAIVAMVFEKSLNLSSTARAKYGTGDLPIWC